MKRFLSLLFPVFYLIYGFGNPAGAAEEILKYHSDIEVQADGSMVVTENISVKAEGRKIRRGIYRDFPTDYKDRLGNDYRVDFEVLEVLKNGEKESFHIKNQGNGVRIYIGSADTLIPPGVYTYTLKYRTDRQVGFFQDHDELYWNVTGNAWDFPIRRAFAVVRLPEKVASSQLKFDAYTGPQGSTQKNFHAHEDPQGRIQFRTTRPLGMREGLTIVVGWPKGIVHEPSGWQRARFILEDNFISILGASGWAVIFFYYFIVWLAVGKDPDKGVIIPRYQAPKDFSPAAVRYLRKMGFDNKTFAAAVIHLAVQGLVTIQEKGKTFVVEKTGKPIGQLPREEKNLFAKLPQKLELKKGKHVAVRSALRAVKTALSVKCEKVYFVRNSIFMVPGIIMTLALLILMAIAPAGDQKPVAFFIIIWLTFWSFGVFSLLRGALAQWKTVFQGHGNILVNGISASVMTFMALPFLGGEIVGLGILAMTTSYLMPLVLVLLAFTNYLFYRWLKAPTHMGRKILDEIEGFRMFLTATEEERLKFLHPPDRTPELFERFLPYALALDVEQLWAEQFSSILAQAGEGEAAYTPAWYHGSFVSGNYSSMASSLGAGLSSSIASASRAPGSSSGFSGGGGGGSSGGGGGGGGGGGW